MEDKHKPSTAASFVWQVLLGGLWVDRSSYGSYEHAVAGSPPGFLTDDAGTWRLVRRTDEVLEPRNIPPGPKPFRVGGQLQTLAAAITEFNQVCGTSITPPHASERVDESMLRLMTGMVLGVTEMLQRAELPPATAVDTGYWQESRGDG